MNTKIREWVKQALELVSFPASSNIKRGEWFKKGLDILDNDSKEIESGSKTIVVGGCAVFLSEVKYNEIQTYISNGDRIQAIKALRTYAGQTKGGDRYYGLKDSKEAVENLLNFKQRSEYCFCPHCNSRQRVMSGSSRNCENSRCYKYFKYNDAEMDG